MLGKILNKVRSKSVAKGQLRHLLTLVGGGFIASGSVDASQVETIVGAVMAIIGVIWSAQDKSE